MEILKANTEQSRQKASLRLEAFTHYAPQKGIANINQLAGALTLVPDDIKTLLPKKPTETFDTQSMHGGVWKKYSRYVLPISPREQVCVTVGEDVMSIDAAEQLPKGSWDPTLRVAIPPEFKPDIEIQRLQDNLPPNIYAYQRSDGRLISEAIPAHNPNDPGEQANYLRAMQLGVGKFLRATKEKPHKTHSMDAM